MRVRYCPRMDWQHFVDTADIVTAVSAVVGVVLAAWLGWKAVQIARSDHDRGEREFLYGQVESLFEAAFALTAAASELKTAPGSDPDPSRRELTLCRERFDGRVRILTSMNQLSQADSELVMTYSLALDRLARANQDLHLDGREVLAVTIFDGSDGHTSGMLTVLVEGSCKGPVWVSGGESFDDDVYEDKVINDLIPPAFRGSVDAAAELRHNLTRPGWRPTRVESLRLVLPWAQERLAIVTLDWDDGEPYQLSSTEPFYLDQEHRPHPGFWDVRQIDQWLDKWANAIGRRGVAENDFAVQMGSEPTRLSPEDLTEQLVQDFRAKFVEQLVTMAKDMRKRLDESRTERIGSSLEE